jgi:glycerophosphoryl diester phosphodiesterase
VAHRGYCDQYPENSLGAFRAAESVGCKWIECDVHASADGSIVVIHDETLDRTTTGTGLVAEMVWSEIASVQLKQHHNHLPEKVPSFTSLLQTLQSGTGVLVEIKPPGARRLTSDVHEMLRAETRPWMIQSFDPDNVLHVWAENPASPAALLVEDDKMLARAISEQWPAVHVRHPLLNGDVVGQLRANKSQVGAWTVNTQEELHRVINLAVDMVITDSARLALELRRRICRPAPKTDRPKSGK